MRSALTVKHVTTSGGSIRTLLPRGGDVTTGGDDPRVCAAQKQGSGDESHTERIMPCTPDAKTTSEQGQCGHCPVTGYAPTVRYERAPGGSTPAPRRLPSMSAVESTPRKQREGSASECTKGRSACRGYELRCIVCHRSRPLSSWPQILYWPQMPIIRHSTHMTRDLTRVVPSQRSGDWSLWKKSDLP